VRDGARAKAFLEILGFRHTNTVVIEGDEFARYMGVPGIQAEQVTLVLENTVTHTEIQLLRYLQPVALDDPNIRKLAKAALIMSVSRSKTSTPRSSG
jgi:hypothetical protein